MMKRVEKIKDLVTALKWPILYSCALIILLVKVLEKDCSLVVDPPLPLPSMRADRNGADTNFITKPLSTMKKRFAHCKQVYLDVGSNIGVQVRKLYQPHLYPDAPVLKVFDTHFGTNNRGQVCAIGIEMNPVHTARLQRLEAYYRTFCGYTVHFFTRSAASTRNSENSTFWTDSDKENHEWGASLMHRPKLTGSSSRVHTMDLARFILEEIQPFASTVVMKLDIEGAEFDVVPDLLLTGAFCNLDLVFVEVHPFAVDANLRAFLDASIVLINSGRINKCKVRVSLLDDETYRHDDAGALAC